MMRPVAGFGGFTLSLACLAQAAISPKDAVNHVGENARVCGLVASATYAQRTKGAPTFLNLDQPYPKQVFTAVIWGSSRSSFAAPPELLRGHKICVAGPITLFRGEPEIVVNNVSQITEQR